MYYCLTGVLYNNECIAALYIKIERFLKQNNQLITGKRKPTGSWTISEDRCVSNVYVDVGKSRTVVGKTSVNRYSNRSPWKRNERQGKFLLILLIIIITFCGYFIHTYYTLNLLHWLILVLINTIFNIW